MWKRFRHNKQTFIKSEWAALKLASDKSAILVAGSGNQRICRRFDSLDELNRARQQGQLSFKYCALSVPRNLCILKWLNLPASDLTEAVKMLEFELPSLLPIPQDQLLYGCTLILSQGNLMEILVFIIKEGKLNDYLEPFHAISADPLRCVPSPIALLQSVCVNVPEVLAGPAINVIISRNRCEFLTSLQGRLVRCDERPLPESPDDHTLSQLMEQIHLCRSHFAALDGSSPLVVLSGSPDWTAKLHDHIRNPDSASFFPNIRVLSVEDGDLDPVEAMETHGLYDLASQNLLPSLNLVPAPILKRHTRRIQRKNQLITAALILLVIGLSWSCLAAMNGRSKELAHRIQTRIAPIQTAAADVETKRRRIKALQNQLSNRGIITRILEDIYKHTPNTISISELRYKSLLTNHTLQIKGQADVLSAAFSYTEAMRDAPLLKNIQLEDAQQVQKTGGSLVEFRARCNIKGPQP